MGEKSAGISATGTNVSLGARGTEGFDDITAIGVNVNIGRGGGVAVNAGSVDRGKGVSVLGASAVRTGFGEHAEMLNNKQATKKTF